MGSPDDILLTNCKPNFRQKRKTILRVRCEEQEVNIQNIKTFRQPLILPFQTTLFSFDVSVTILYNYVVLKMPAYH